MCIYPRCSGTVAKAHSILQVSCNGSKPVVVILISLISGWLGIRHGKSARELLGTMFSFIKGDTWEEIAFLSLLDTLSVCDGWSCSSHLEIVRTGIRKLLRMAEQGMELI